MRRGIRSTAFLLLAVAAFHGQRLFLTRHHRPSFFDLWAVPAARRTAGVRDPYRDPRYAVAVARAVASNGSPLLRHVWRLKGGESPRRSPLLYTLAMFLPRDYGRAYRWATAVGLACTALALLLLARTAGGGSYLLVPLFLFLAAPPFGVLRAGTPWGLCLLLLAGAAAWRAAAPAAAALLLLLAPPAAGALVPFLLRRPPPARAWVAGGAALLAGLLAGSLALAGPGSWTAWVATLPAGRGFPESLGALLGLPSGIAAAATLALLLPAGFLLRSSLPEAPAPLLVLGAALAFALIPGQPLQSHLLLAGAALALTGTAPWAGAAALFLACGPGALGPLGPAAATRLPAFAWLPALAGAFRRQRAANPLPAYAALLVLSALPLHWEQAQTTPGVDFYALWAPARARAAAALGNPYRERQAYGRVLQSLAARSGDRLFAEAQALRVEPRFTAAPPLLALGALYPRSYSAARRLHYLSALLAFAAALLLLGRALGVPVSETAFLGGAALIGYDPLLSDLGVGNTNCWQLLGLVLAATLLARPGTALRVAAGLAVACLLALCKLNLLPAALALGITAFLRAGPSRFARAVPLAAGAVAAGVLLPLLLLGRSSLWAEWAASFVPEQGGEPLVFPDVIVWDHGGNYSPLLWATSLGGLPFRGALIGCALFLLATGLLFAWGRLRHVLADPWRTAGGGVIALLALSPLVWLHYHVLLLLPAAWLLGRSSPRAWVPASCGLAMACERWFLPLTPPWSLPVTLAWLPVWVGLAWSFRREP